MYFSGWSEPFQASFATSAASHGAVPLVQMDPTGVKLKAITYLVSFADAVRSYGRPVILCFGHEMNGTWYSLGRRGRTPRTAKLAANAFLATKISCPLPVIPQTACDRDKLSRKLA